MGNKKKHDDGKYEEEWIVISGEDSTAERYDSKEAMMDEARVDFSANDLSGASVLHVQIIKEYKSEVIQDPLELAEI
jgi:hypothetical protein